MLSYFYFLTVQLLQSQREAKYLLNPSAFPLSSLMMEMENVCGCVLCVFLVCIL